MEDCIFKIKQVTFETGIFDAVVDCTYILLCCGPKPSREASVYLNLNKLKPTQNVKLIYNTGYRNCAHTVSPSDDLSSAQLYIFNDAIKNNYKRILFLEDDFIVPNLISKRCIDDIIAFIQKKNPSLYGLGNFMIPTLSTLMSHHQTPILQSIAMAHAVMYNTLYMSKVIEYYSIHSVKIHQDRLPTYLTGIKIHRYYKPLICQTFPVTDNQKYGWTNGEVPFIIVRIWVRLIRFLRLDTQVQPGFTIMYTAPYIIYLILLVMICTIVHIINKTYRRFR